MDSRTRALRPPIFSAAFVSLASAYCAWGALAQTNWMWAIEAGILAAAAFGLWTNRSWARWPVWTVALLTAVQWGVLTGFPIVASRPSPSLFLAIVAFTPGIGLLASCGAVSFAVARHFGLRPRT